MPVDTTHPVFKAPQNKDQKIWRYMDFIKFVCMLENGELYFSSLESLTRDDPFEGSLGKPNVQAREVTFKMYQAAGGKDFDEKTFTAIQSALKANSSFQKNLRKILYANCWHMNDYESAAMWSAYLKAGQGIAITTTYRNLLDSLSGSSETLYIGTISYIDHDQEGIPGGNVYSPAVYKRKSFEHEKELRAFYAPLDGENLKKANDPNASLPPGVNFKVNLNRLIGEIVISPTAEAWFTDLVRKVSARFSVQSLIRPSSIQNAPYF